MAATVEKVTAFIIRSTPNGPLLLLFEHPNAGIQIPAGTVEAGETPEQAVLREIKEETGLTAPVLRRYLGMQEENLPEDQRLVASATTVYARPDLSSFDWAHLHRGTPVEVLRQVPGFTQVKYEEWDQVPDSNYVTLSITGWVPNEVLAERRKRHFFHLEMLGSTPESWEVETDNHVFRLFWAPLAALPEIISPQNEWLRFLLPPASN